MAWTEADEDRYQALNAAYKRGVRSVTFGDRTTVQYSEEEMARILSKMEAQKARSTSPPRPRQFLGYAKKGF
jgi:hypothetical protein